MVYILGYGGWYQWGKSVKECVNFYLVFIAEKKKYISLLQLQHVDLWLVIGLYIHLLQDLS